MGGGTWICQRLKEQERDPEDESVRARNSS